jgi:nitrite reductase/ring-hydroxylating ferredoxin subunit
MDTQPPGYVYAICSVRDIPNRRGKGFHLLRREPDGTETPWHILVVRWDKKLYGYVNRCPHQGVNLDSERNQFLDPNGTRLICGKHGALFQVETGECLEGPCRGTRLEPVRLSVLDGDICVTGVALAEADDAGADARSGASGGAVA